MTSGPIPLYGFLEGDTLGLLILAYGHETIQNLAEKLQRSAQVRVPPMKRFKLIYQNQELDLALTVEKAKIQALDRFDVRIVYDL